MAIYLNDWEETGEAGMLSDFSIPQSALDGMEVLVASYTYECYSGDAFVLLKRGEELLEVNGSHCSCYGLSESDYCGNATTQWDPEVTSREAVLHRLDASYGEQAKIAEAIRTVLTS